MKIDKYVKLEDILKIIPEDDKTGPKPSYIRKYLKNLQYIELVSINKEDYSDYTKGGNIELSFWQMDYG